nr:uncharacterized protein LOC9266233 isoform X3 [Oryza sativa Japonica Group]
MRMFDVNETLLSNLPYYADHRYRSKRKKRRIIMSHVSTIIRSWNKRIGGVPIPSTRSAPCSALPTLQRRAWATMACSAQSAQGRGRERRRHALRRVLREGRSIGNGAELGIFDVSSGCSR